ncbi:hypothetical protein N8630_01965 [Synechococcus sp. AH-601-C19]|nr:hypothetical protein [Synechococcus sp. AH-601-C19]
MFTKAITIKLRKFSLISLLVGSTFLGIPKASWSQNKDPILDGTYGVVAVANERQLKSFVYAVDTQTGSGSLVLIGRRGNKYFGITAAHVVSDGAGNGGFDININNVSASGEIEHSLLDNGIDLAIISFNNPTSEKLPLAIIHTSLKDAISKDVPNFIDILKIQENNSVISVSGYSMPTTEIQQSIYRTETTMLKERAYANADGYEFAYSATTVPGMSGGGLLMWISDSNLATYPVLIGIHGRSEGYDAGGRSGVSLGIPIDLIGSTIASSTKFGIPSNRNIITQEISNYKHNCHGFDCPSITGPGNEKCLDLPRNHPAFKAFGCKN